MGSPFALKTRDDQTLNVTSYQITLNGATIPTALLDSKNDPNGVINPGYAYVILQQPLASGVTYAFQASGDVSGTPFAVSFTVSTR